MQHSLYTLKVTCTTGYMWMKSRPWIWWGSIGCGHFIWAKESLNFNKYVWGRGIGYTPLCGNSCVRRCAICVLRLSVSVDWTTLYNGVPNSLHVMSRHIYAYCSVTYFFTVIGGASVRASPSTFTLYFDDRVCGILLDIPFQMNCSSESF